MKILENKYKKNFKLLQTGHCDCKRCYRNARGRYVVFQDKGTPSVNGSKAFRIFFVCNDRSHLNFVGYTKPVDHTLNHGEHMNKHLSTYGEDIEEMDEELEKFIKDNSERVHKTYY